MPAKKRIRLDEETKSTTSESSVNVSLYSSDDDSLNLDLDPQEEKEEERPSSPEVTPDDPLLKPSITKDSEDSDASKGYYAVVYTDKLRYYWGKINKTFRNDVGKVVERAEVEFLRRKNVSSDLNM